MNTQQGPSEFLQPKIQYYLDKSTLILVTIPVSTLFLFAGGGTIMYIGSIIGLESIRVLWLPIAIAPIGIPIFYLIRFVPFRTKRLFGSPVDNQFDIYVRNPLTDQTFPVTSRSILAVGHLWVFTILAMVWLALGRYYQAGPGAETADDLTYIFNHSDLLAAILDSTLKWFYPVRAFQSGVESLAILVILIISLFIIRSAVILVEEIIDSFREDSLQRLIGFFFLHYHFGKLIYQNWLKSSQVIIGMIINYYFYKLIVMVSVFQVCLAANEGLSTLKCIVI